jgi:hypothetical protein
LSASSFIGSRLRSCAPLFVRMMSRIDARVVGRLP